MKVINLGIHHLDFQLVHFGFASFAFGIFNDSHFEFLVLIRDSKLKIDWREFVPRRAPVRNEFDEIYLINSIITEFSILAPPTIRQLGHQKNPRFGVQYASLNYIVIT